MSAQRYWFQQGRLLETSSTVEISNPESEERRFRTGDVRLTTGNLGNEVKWHVNSPCVASLFSVIQRVATAPAPIFLRFFAVGWFEEIYAEPAAAILRMEEVLARGDRHFTSRIFVKEADADTTVVPDVLQAALDGRSVPAEYAVNCSYDEGRRLFRVERVGAKSAIGRVWGTFTTSHPCQSEGSYGDQVNATYSDVLKSGRPRYDHVIAALRLPDNAIYWVPYQRVVFPRRSENGTPGVEVISQIAKVDIQVL